MKADPFPLNEPALQAAGQTAPFVGRDVCERIISTYLAEAGFEIEKRGKYQPDPRLKGIRVYVYTEQRQVGPWIPIDTVEKED
jgi:hypothetical protein